MFVSRYDGSYENGQRNGFGTMIYPDQSQYRGSWKDGKKHGRGEYAFVNGDRYVGEYDNDVRHGFGTYYFNCEKSSQFSGLFSLSLFSFPFGFSDLKFPQLINGRQSKLPLMVKCFSYRATRLWNRLSAL